MSMKQRMSRMATLAILWTKLMLKKHLSSQKMSKANCYTLPQNVMKRMMAKREYLRKKIDILYLNSSQNTWQKMYIFSRVKGIQKYTKSRWLEKKPIPLLFFYRKSGSVQLYFWVRRVESWLQVFMTPSQILLELEHIWMRMQMRLLLFWVNYAFCRRKIQEQKVLFWRWQQQRQKRSKTSMNSVMKKKMMRLPGILLSSLLKSLSMIPFRRQSNACEGVVVLVILPAPLFAGLLLLLVLLLVLPLVLLLLLVLALVVLVALVALVGSGRGSSWCRYTLDTSIPHESGVVPYMCMQTSILPTPSVMEFCAPQTQITVVLQVISNIVVLPINSLNFLPSASRMGVIHSTQTTYQPAEVMATECVTLSKYLTESRSTATTDSLTLAGMLAAQQIQKGQVQSQVSWQTQLSKSLGPPGREELEELPQAGKWGSRSGPSVYRLVLQIIWESAVCKHIIMAASHNTPSFYFGLIFYQLSFQIQKSNHYICHSRLSGIFQILPASLFEITHHLPSPSSDHMLDPTQITRISTIQTLGILQTQPNQCFHICMGWAKKMGGDGGGKSDRYFGVLISSQKVVNLQQNKYNYNTQQSANHANRTHRPAHHPHPLPNTTQLTIPPLFCLPLHLTLQLDAFIALAYPNPLSILNPFAFYSTILLRLNSFHVVLRGFLIISACSTYINMAVSRLISNLPQTQSPEISAFAQQVENKEFKSFYWLNWQPLHLSSNHMKFETQPISQLVTSSTKAYLIEGEMGESRKVRFGSLRQQMLALIDMQNISLALRYLSCNHNNKLITQHYNQYHIILSNSIEASGLLLLIVILS